MCFVNSSTCSLGNSLTCDDATDKEFYETKCNAINDKNGVFSECINRIGNSLVAEFFDNCAFDGCITKEESSVCQSLSAFAQYCRSVEVYVNWEMTTGCADCEYIIL